MLGLGDDVIAFLVDEALATRLTAEALNASRPALSDGQRWATEDDYEPLPDPSTLPVAYPELLE